MFVSISNEPRSYAWGSATALAELTGREPSGSPEAELWLGAHPGSPSRVLDPAVTGGATDLAEWISRAPEAALGPFVHAGRLPFLLKLLAADSPLSLQAHPTAEQARAGFARENEAGIGINSPERNYRDPFPKPELIYVLSESFEALCGFRQVAECRTIIEALLDADARQLDPQPGPLEDLLELLQTGLRPAFEWLVNHGSGVATLVASVSHLASEGGRFPVEFATVRALAEQYPGDPGIVISLLLNRVSLRRGEALYLPAGNIHAYLRGVGVEVMTSSDNVLRGGLTPKHVDVGELLNVLDFTEGPVPYLRSEHPSTTVEVFRPPVPGFILVRVTGDAAPVLTGPAIIFCTAGEFTLSGAISDATIAPGSSLYVTPDEAAVTISGSGELFLATTGV